MLVAGGQGAATVLASAELYDPVNGRWSPTGSLVTARSGHTLTVLTNGRVLAVGGRGAGFILASAQVYHPDSGVWEYERPFPGARTQHSATLLPDGRVLVSGVALAQGVSPAP